MKRYMLYWGVIVLLGMLISGCTSTGQEKAAADAEAAGAGAEAGMPGGEATPLAKGEGLQMDPLHDPASPLSKRIIYFDFDSAQVRTDYVDVIAAHGQYLASHPNQHVRLEGHTDERGSREYNLGLGEYRAQTVSQMLKLEGVDGAQLELISYGEEMPAAFGHDEESWELNRRVEIVYLGQ
jgi:peptidoglycan-associated lipoprotein